MPQPIDPCPYSDGDAPPLVSIIDARVLREPHRAYPLSEGHHPYICSDIETDIELCGIALPPIVVTVCSNNVLFGRPINQSTWPTLEWIYWAEVSAFFDSLRTRSGDCVIALEDLREAVLDAAQWHPIVHSAFRGVGQMIEDVLERGPPTGASQGWLPGRSPPAAATSDPSYRVPAACSRAV